MILTEDKNTGELEIYGYSTSAKDGMFG